MNNSKKRLCIFTILIIFIYFTILCFSNGVLASTRTEDLSILTNYPEIYTAIQELKTAHPNWTFTVLDTGLDWNTVLEKETTAKHFRSVVHKSYTTINTADWVCSTCITDKGEPVLYEKQWYCASSKTVSFYLDPRNWLNERYIFAFETLSFNENVHTVDGINSIIKGSFMEGDTITYIDTAGNTQTINKSYAQVIYEAGKEQNVSPYHLAARIIQEQGKDGSSTSSGNYTYTDSNGAETKYFGYYNFFNIGSTAPSGSSISEVIKNGLESAKDKKWTTPELAIKGGASFLSSEYINGYQDSLYLQKFGVDDLSNCLYWHQYQQNLSAPYTESTSIRKGYTNLGILDSNFNFIIPIYKNMPETASVKPGREVILQTDSVIVATQSSALTLRDDPYITSDNNIASVPKGTVLTRIEKATYASTDGIYWDKVAYNTGTETIIGYATREYLTETETPETVNQETEIAVMCNLRNGPGTTDTNVKQVLKVGTKVTIIDKMNYKMNGHTWYKVKLEDGTQGYISSDYISKEKYKIEEKNIIIQPDIVITDIPDMVLQGEIFGTGAKATIGENEYTIIMLGDVSGDGEVDIIDLALMKRHLMQTQVLSGDLLRAGILQKNATEVDVIDLALLKRFLMGMTEISL